MFTLNPDYAVPETATETPAPRFDNLGRSPKNRVGDFFSESSDRVGSNEPVTLIVTIEITVYRYETASGVHKYLYANAGPAMYTDPSGMFSLGEMMVAIAVRPILSSVTIGAVFGGASYLALSQDKTWWGFVEATVIGGLTGLISGGIGALGGRALIATGATKIIPASLAPYIGSFSAGYFGTYYAAKRKGFSTKDAVFLAMIGGGLSVGGSSVADDLVMRMALPSVADGFFISLSGAVIGSGVGPVFDGLQDVFHWLDQSSKGELPKKVFGGKN